MNQQDTLLEMTGVNFWECFSVVCESRIGFDGQKEIFLLGIFLKVRKKANEIVFQRSNQFRSNFCRLRFSYVVVNLSTKEVKRGNCQSLIKDWIFLYNKHPI